MRFRSFSKARIGLLLLGIWLFGGAQPGAAQTVTTITNYAVNALVKDQDPSGRVSAQSFSTPIVSLTDLNVRLKINGSCNGDLYCYLTHGTGFSVLLNRVGRTTGQRFGYCDSGIDVTFDDEASAGDVHVYRLTLNGSHTIPIAGSLTNQWAPDGRTSSPTNVLDTDSRVALLNSFDGLNPNGEWVLFVADLEAGGLQTLVSWGLEATGFTPPLISLQPASQTISCGSGNATLSVEAGGTAPIRYQWRLNGSPLADATNSTLIVGSSPTQVGNYEVVITNNYGSITSAVATLTIVDTTAPVITCSTNRLVHTTSSGGIAVMFTISASDLCDLSPTVACTPSSGSIFALGTTTVNCTARDAANNTATCSFTVTVVLNHAPIGGNDELGVLKNQARAVALDKLLLNDSDEDGDPLTVLTVSPLSTNGGTVTISGTDVIYAPTTNFVGSDRFTYTVSDGMGGTAVVPVFVTVWDGNDASANRISQITVTGQGALLRFAGIPGFTYRIERSANLETWASIAVLTAPANGIVEFTDPEPLPPTAFYRTFAP